MELTFNVERIVNFAGEAASVRAVKIFDLNVKNTNGTTGYVALADVNVTTLSSLTTVGTTPLAGAAGAMTAFATVWPGTKFRFDASGRFSFAG